MTVKGMGAWMVLSLILSERGKNVRRSDQILQVTICSIAGVSNRVLVW